MTDTSAPTPLWSPSEARVRAAKMTAFVRFVRAETPQVDDWDSLYAWSVEAPEAFWQAIWRFAGVVASSPAERVVDDPSRMPGARWFEGARLNFAENLLRHAGDHPEQEALVAWNERGRQQAFTYAELESAVARTARALEAMGVGVGDRVAGFLPNIPEAIIAMLATASLGAVWSSCSPDFGVKGVLDRFGQITPKVLFAADGYFYAGKHFDSLERVRGILDAIPAIERAVIIPYTDSDATLIADHRVVSWSAFHARHLRNPNGGADGSGLSFAQLPFDHPLYVMYSSGTTGLPKCLVHSAGGTLLQHLKELVLHTDLGLDDRIFYFTTCGWMMWNWLVSSLATGATVVLYDGAPTKPRQTVLWELAEAERLTVFGTSAKYLALCEKTLSEKAVGAEPAADAAKIAGTQTASTQTLGERFNLMPLRAILSTGSPLAPESFDFVYREVKRDLCLSSISGGTDIISCFALGNPILPVYRGELQSRGLGLAVAVWDEDGEPVVGEAGELVCTQAFPSMPIGFWGDEDGSRYRAAYFEHFPGIWTHGDWVEQTPRGGLIIHGRSDATLNPGGVRIGTAEIYRQVELLEEVLESLVIGQQHDDDVRVVLFVRLREGATLDDALEARIRHQIKRGASPHHVPRKIIAVPDLPRTISGKLTELAVRNVVHGRDVKNRDALANPEALEFFRDLPALRT